MLITLQKPVPSNKIDYMHILNTKPYNVMNNKTATIYNKFYDC